MNRINETTPLNSIAEFIRQEVTAISSGTELTYDGDEDKDAIKLTIEGQELN